MTMGDANGNSGTTRALQRISAEVVQVRVDDVIGWYGAKHVGCKFLVSPKLSKRRSIKQFAFQRLNFLVEITWLFAVDKKIHLTLSAICVPQDVHQPRLDSSSIHPRDDVQNSYRRSAAARPRRTHLARRVSSRDGVVAGGGGHGGRPAARARG